MNRKQVVFLSGLAMICSCLFISLAAIAVSGPTNVTPTPLRPDPIEARTMCAEWVLGKLRSPATAEFVLDTEQVFNVRDRPKNYYIVRGQVDAQNGFGAIIRSDYACQLHYDPENPDIWHLDKIEIN